MNRKMYRDIPLKNYIILGVIILVTLLLLYYFYMWVDLYKESRNNYPIMDKYMTVIYYNELNDYLVENPDTLVYVSVLEDDEIREFEKKFKNKFRNNDIDIDMLYMDITIWINDNKFIDEVSRKYSLNNLSMLSVPCILNFNGGELSSIYSIKDNDYNLDSLISYLDNILLDGDVM